MPHHAPTNDTGDAERRDHALFVAAVEGDAAALAAFVERHQRAVYGYLKARLLDAEDAAGLTQQVFCDALGDAERFRTSDHVGRELLDLATVRLRQFAARRRGRPVAAWTHLCLELDGIEQEGADPQAAAVDAHEMAAVAETSSSLPESQREALSLYYRDRFSIAEIALKLRRSEEAARSLLARARAAFVTAREREVDHGA